jgi:hypothetical protein
MDNIEILGHYCYSNYELRLNDYQSMITAPNEFGSPKVKVSNSINNLQLWKKTMLKNIYTVFN